MPSQLQISHDLGDASLQRGDLKEARKHFRNMVKESHKHSEKDQACALNRLGSVCVQEQKYDEAEDAFTKSVQLHKKIFGDAHPETATELSNLGFVIWQGSKNIEKAKPLLEESVKILQNNMPFSDEVSENELESYASSFANLAGLKEEEKDFAAAEALYQTALDINLKASDGECSQAVIRSLYYLSGCLENQGRAEEGDKLLGKFLPQLNRMARELNDPRLAPIIEEFEKRAAETEATEETSETE